MDELLVKCFLHANDQVILAPFKYELQEMVTKLDDSVKKSVMKVNIRKTKMSERGESTTECEDQRGRDAISAVCIMCEVSRKDRCRSSDVRERCGSKEDVVTRVERDEGTNFMSKREKSWTKASCRPPAAHSGQAGERPSPVIPPRTPEKKDLDG
ncbi:hypothetical protein EVAR_86096_1 [Eumeta japonica]|uniref:Reverse transcriptase domain-containing protein n=1 Tax=Eumeta variegata TaxID=151549 RepID=A0A4C1V2F5_EUMVA|nr:hypothetical protein EVAR_86096_1 [Eumeta japonica]